MLKKPENKPTNSTITYKIALFLIAAFFITKIIFSAFVPENRLIFASDLTTDNILKAVNEQRALRNLVTLNNNIKLTNAAQSKADDMQTRHYFAHVDPDGHYIWDKIVAEGYTPYLQLGENLAIEFYDTGSLITAWINSPTHRANLLNENFKDQGMGLNFGDTAVGQYHSAIANTFGTLALPPSVKTKPASSEKTSGTNNRPRKTKKPAAPSPTYGKALGDTTPSPSAPSQPVVTRGSEELATNVTSKANRVATDNTPNLPQQNLKQKSTTDAVVGQKETAILINDGINRYLILIGGLALLIFLIYDFRKNTLILATGLDKKGNNLIILLLSIIAVAFLYWL